MSGSLFDSLPLWLLFILTMLLVVLAVEAGSRIGTVLARKYESQRNAPIDTLVGATLGLLAFMLAFTFGTATTRNDARKQFVVDEAVAIRAADLRAQLLPDPYRSDIRALLLQYVDARLAGALNPRQTLQAIERSEKLHELLWLRIADVPPADRAPIAAAVVEVVGLHVKRVNAALHSRIHTSIWMALYGLIALSMGFVGYGAGISGRHSHIAVAAVAVAFSVILVLIADLDRPQQGLIRVSQQAMLDLQLKLRPREPPVR
jgi:hypothetical protein